MSIAQNNVKKDLENLKKRAMARKNNHDLRHSTSEQEKQLMNEHADLLYQSQLDTINDD